MNWVARRVWYGLMWFMRRPPIKKMRQKWILWLPEAKREAAWASFQKQERWARKHGLLVVKITVIFFFGIMFFQLVAAWVYWQQAQGSFNVELP